MNPYKYSIAKKCIVFALLLMMSSMVEAGDLQRKDRSDDAAVNGGIEPPRTVTVATEQTKDEIEWAAKLERDKLNEAAAKERARVNAENKAKEITEAIQRKEKRDQEFAALMRKPAFAEVIDWQKRQRDAEQQNQVQTDERAERAAILAEAEREHPFAVLMKKYGDLPPVPVSWPVGSKEWSNDTGLFVRGRFACFDVEEIKLPPVNPKTAWAWAELEERKPFFVLGLTKPREVIDRDLMYIERFGGHEIWWTDSRKETKYEQDDPRSNLNLFMIFKDGDSVTCVPVATLCGIFGQNGETYMVEPMSLGEVLETDGETIEEKIDALPLKQKSSVIGNSDYEKKSYLWQRNQKKKRDLRQFFNRPLEIADVTKLVEIGGVYLFPDSMARIIRNYMPNAASSDKKQALALLSNSFLSSDGLREPCFFYTDDDFQSLTDFFATNPQESSEILAQYKNNKPSLFNWVSGDYRNWLESSSAKVDPETKERLLELIEELYRKQKLMQKP